ncbi:DNA polymerase Y family protein, partial [Rhizobium sp. BR5]
QALGEAGEPIEPVRVAELVEVRRAFPEPIAAAETIARYTQKLVAELCTALEKRGLGARRVDLVLHRVDSGLQAIRAGTSRPVRDVKQLVRLLTDRIDTIDPGFGIEMMVLTATHAEPLVAAQARSSLLEEGRAEVADTVDVILNRGHRVYRHAAVASDVPERS